MDKNPQLKYTIFISTLQVYSIHLLAHYNTHAEHASLLRENTYKTIITHF